MSRIERGQITARRPEAHDHHWPAAIGPPVREVARQASHVGWLLVEAPETGREAEHLTT
jgi:hypothetical protein